MSKLTKKRALELCVSIWNWVGLNPAKQKDAWSDWIHNGGLVKRMNHDCPCCEYAGGTFRSNKNRNCRKCPLLKFWNGSERNSDYDTPCENKGSPFQMWSEAISHENMTAHAFEIRDAAKRELSKLRK